MITNEPLTEATLLTAAAVPTAVIRHHGITMDDLRPLFDAGYSAIAASGAPIAGPAFALYTGDVSTWFDLELGFPVTDPLTGPIGEVEPSELPAGDVLVVSHLGGYDGLGPAWGGLFGAAAQRGLQPRGSFYEVYVTEPTPDTDPATLRTDLFIQV